MSFLPSCLPLQVTFPPRLRGKQGTGSPLRRLPADCNLDGQVRHLLPSRRRDYRGPARRRPVGLPGNGSRPVVLRLAGRRLFINGRVSGPWLSRNAPKGQRKRRRRLSTVSRPRSWIVAGRVETGGNVDPALVLGQQEARPASLQPSLHHSR